MLGRVCFRSIVVAQAQQVVQAWRDKGCWVHVHVSTPCASGSPLKNFSEGPSDAEYEWAELMKAASRYLKLGDAKSSELPLKETESGKGTVP